MDQCSALLFPCRAEGSCKSASFGSIADKPLSIISGYKASKLKVKGGLYTHMLRALSQAASSNCSPNVTNDFIFFLLEIFPFGQMLALSL